MPAFILTRRSVILCPHGGIVTHIPMTFSEYLINGELPMLLTDQYLINGCPNILGTMPSACFKVVWTSASVYLIIKGSPALLNTSVGLCQAMNGAVQGPAIISSFQTTVAEPTEITVVS